MSQAQRSPFSCAVEQDCTAQWMHLELPHGLSEIQTSWTNVGSLQLSPRPKRKDLGKSRFYEAGWEMNTKFSNISLNIFLLHDNFWIIQPINTKNSGNAIATIVLDTTDFNINWNKKQGKHRRMGRNGREGVYKCELRCVETTHTMQKECGGLYLYHSSMIHIVTRIQ